MDGRIHDSRFAASTMERNTAVIPAQAGIQCLCLSCLLVSSTTDNRILKGRASEWIRALGEEKRK